MFLNGYPYTDFHELNLDFILNAMKTLEQAFKDFTASNSLIFAEPLLHDLTKSYAKNTIVLDKSGNAYIALKAVPDGVQLSNSEYWMMVFNFEDYTEKANMNFTDNYFRDTDRSDRALAIGDWVVLDDILYKVTVAIPVDGLFEVGANIVHFTVEQFLKDFVTTINQTVLQYKNDIDASELAYRNQLAQDIADTTASLQAQLDVAIAGATVDSEVINARVGWDNTTYATLGDAIRTQIENVVDNNVVLSNFPALEWTLKRNVDGTGAIVTNNYTAITTLVLAEPNDIIIRRTPASDGTWLLLVYINEYDSTQTWIKRTELQVNDKIVLDSTTKYVRFAFGRGSGSGVIIDNSDLSMFNCEFYRKSALNCNTFLYRGRVTDFGSSIASCVDDGYYRFTTGDIPSISDLPMGWSSGGIVKTYVFNPTTRWQVVEGQEGAYIRYGSGVWYNIASDNIYVSYDGTAGDDASTEQLNIYLPRVNSVDDSILYNLGHCVDAGRNCDVWRIINAYQISGGTSTIMTRNGEWECALHLNGAPDFMGGYTHGDEIETEIKAFKDGMPANISSINGTCKEFKIVRTSILYDPSDGVTAVAKHGVEYIFTHDGVKISQSVKWLLNENLTKCYLAMLPVLKTYSTYSYSNIDYEIVTNGSGNYDVPIPNAKSVTEYANGKTLHFTMSIGDYPSGMTGGDCALITDNGGLTYNKVYFVICTSGNVHSGDIWTSETFYKHK